MTKNIYNIVNVPEIIDELNSGNMIILVDDPDRENEGDLVVLTEHLNIENLTFMMFEARGLPCCSLSEARALELNLIRQVTNNQSRFHTPFTVTVDAVSVGLNGAKATSRVKTMKALIDKNIGAKDLTVPGHVYPLIADPRGVIGRRGQTEGSYDLSRIAGSEEPSGVICEILNIDGSVARGKSLNSFADKHKLKITSIEEIFKYRLFSESKLIRETIIGEVLIKGHKFEVRVFEDDIHQKEHLVLIYHDGVTKEPLVRLHSECITGDIFGSLRCDCGQQLNQALELVVKQGYGIVLYLPQEGRGIGLVEKLRAYGLQDLEGLDTVEANLLLGHKNDEREYNVATYILKALKVSRCKLLTNNPDKINALTAQGIIISERIPLIITPDKYSEHYLTTKREKCGHLL
jgi:3,4-dihydroxy 2-butanone 4-phosphate synthase / GTP cyclohydrolase II